MQSSSFQKNTVINDLIKKIRKIPLKKKAEEDGFKLPYSIPSI